MLRMSWYCSDCGAKGTVSEEEMVDLMGACPKCLHHKGNVEYSCNMTKDEFLTELANMTESMLLKYHTAVIECAYDLSQQ